MNMNLLSKNYAVRRLDRYEVEVAYQNKGIGSKIIKDVCSYK